MSEEQVLEIAQVPDDATLLRHDSSGIRSRLEEDPWITSARVYAVPFGTLTIVVQETTFDAVVEVPVNAASNQASTWAISSSGMWIGKVEEGSSSATTSASTTTTPSPTPSATPSPTPSVSPTPTPTTDSQSTGSGEGALTDAISEEMGTKPRITDVSASEIPEAGANCQDSGVLAALQLLSSLSDDMLGEVTSISAPDDQTLTVTLDNGVEVAFGSLDDIETKERVASDIMKAHEGSVTYINVRVADRPSWRGL
jgi:cell division protein FtsQ